MGVLGGSFDPVHLGHLIVAQEAQEELGLGKVLFIPAGQPYLKGRELSLAPHRLGMVRLAIAGNPAFEVSPVELDREGPSYTVDTLSGLQRQEQDLVLLLGWDALMELPRWHHPERLLRLCRLAVVPRPGFPFPDLPSLEKALPGIRDRLHLLSWPVLDISSSLIRQRVKQGRSIRYLVPPAVGQYIEERGLYR